MYLRKWKLIRKLFKIISSLKLTKEQTCMVFWKIGKKNQSSKKVNTNENLTRNKSMR